MNKSSSLWVWLLPAPTVYKFDRRSLRLKNTNREEQIDMRFVLNEANRHCRKEGSDQQDYRVSFTERQIGLKDVWRQISSQMQGRDFMVRA
ncbi:MAG: hypothetical protein WC647_13090 [Desulfomonilaceae bacterium]